MHRILFKPNYRLWFRCRATFINFQNEVEALPWGNDLPGVNKQILEFSELRDKIDELQTNIPQCENENKVFNKIIKQLFSPVGYYISQ